LMKPVRSIAMMVMASLMVFYPFAPARTFAVGTQAAQGKAGNGTAYYFAEGTCRPNFDSYICILNPGGSAAEVTITYMTGVGTTTPQNISVPAHSRATVHPADVLGVGDDAAHDFSAKVECTNGQRIVAERPVYFNYNGVWSGGHDVVGATATSSTYYFAEGTSRPNFDPYICIQNPSDGDAAVTITYMKGDDTNATSTLTVPGRSRSTVSPRATLGTGDDAAHDFSARVECTNGQGIIAERPMYFNYNGVWSGGHDVVGATAPAFVFYFAEGTCRPGFDPYTCIQNPGEGDASVTITYMKGDGTAASDSITIPPASRRTVHPADILGVGDDAAHDFSTKVECINGQRIIAERPMYFNYNGAWSGGHDVVGTTAADTAYYFAEGTCRPGFDPYICIQNPGDGDAAVTVTYMTGDGTTTPQEISVPAHSRSTVHPSDVLGVGDDAAHDFSARVACTNGQRIVAERPMYFNYNGVWSGGHDVVGAVDTRTLPDVKFFAYQIQDQEQPAKMNALIDSHYDLLVIDQTRSNKGEETYDSRGDVMRLKSSAGSRGRGKIVLCYLDVGEAESYRWYWQSGWHVGNPAWIIAPDPGGWDENYPVAYWNAEWKSIMLEAIDRIIDDGYDGVYLDWLEAYSFKPVADAARAQGLDPRTELITFVRELQEHARQRDPGFIFVAQNAAELGAYPDWIRLFDGIGQEAVWYDGAGDPDAGGTPGDVPVDPGLTRELLQDLSVWLANGKVVLDTEYAQKPANATRAYSLGASHGVKTYVTLVPLDKLSSTPPPGY
jgi:cysteinyl-tRNA synthetase, unknown class